MLGVNQSGLSKQNAFLRFARLADKATFYVCIFCLISVFLSQTLVVVLRYLFAIGFVELQNFVTYAFAVFCVLAVPLAIRADKHVRVDVFRDRLNLSIARRFDNIAIIILLFPVFGFALYHAMPLVIYSWSIIEGSRDTGGLPGYFIVLTALPLMCILMLIQGLAILLDDGLIHAAAGKEDN